MPDGGLHYPALVLDADFRPLCYFPRSLGVLQDTVTAVFVGSVPRLGRDPNAGLTFDHVRRHGRGRRTPSSIANAAGRKPWA